MFFLLCNVFSYVSLLLNFCMTFTVHPWVLGYIRHLRTLRNIERWVHQSISEEYSLHPLCNISSQPLWVSKDRFQSRYTSLTARAHSMEEEPLTEKKTGFCKSKQKLSLDNQTQVCFREVSKSHRTGRSSSWHHARRRSNSLWTERKVLEKTGGENQEDVDAPVRC